MKKFQKIRGMHQVDPNDSEIWSTITKKIIQIFESYSYKEIRLPIIESTELFLRSVGEETDIVNKGCLHLKVRAGNPVIKAWKEQQAVLELQLKWA